MEPSRAKRPKDRDTESRLGFELLSAPGQLEVEPRGANMSDELRKEVMADAVSQAFNEAKSAIMRCAESMANDDDMLSVAVGASVNVAAATIEAILGLKDSAAELPH